MFGTGGLNAIIGALGMTLFRGGCRYSVVILAIALSFAARRASALLDREQRAPSVRFVGWGCAAALALLVAWDQVPRPPAPSARAAVARQIDSDRDFVARIDALLPPGAMVFQIPSMEFPEAPAPGIPAYEQLRPYCLGSRLHWSFGTVKGRPREAWIRDLGNKDMRQVLAELRSRGFVAVVVHRNGFTDKGRAIEASLIDSGCRPPVRSRAGDLSCIVFDAPASGAEPR
jgi:phosphoglycerol transferase